MAPNATGGRCAHCHKPLAGGLRYPFKGQTLCYDCYTAVQKELAAKEEKLQDLYRFLKQDIFKGQELEVHTIETINYALDKDKRTVNGIKKTLIYYYKILNNHPGEQQSIGWIIKVNYDNAKKFYTEQAEIRKRNDAVSLNATPIKMTIDPEKLHRDGKKDKFTYRMEDL